MDHTFVKTLENHSRSNDDHDHDHSHGLWIQLPDDILFDILVRLPVKSLMRFQYVCKSWYFFLTCNDPAFIDLQLSRSQSRLSGTKLLISTSSFGERQCRCFQSLLLVDLEKGDRNGRATQPLTMPCNPHHSFSLSESIKGLVCWHQRGYTKKIMSIYICNPSTRELMKLPVAPQNQVTKTNMHVYYYFGFDPSSKEFKVLTIQFASFPWHCGVAFWIFTLGGKSWRQIHPPDSPFGLDNDEPPWFIELENCVCLHGALHWIRMLKQKKAIVVFDLRDENFHAISIPNINSPFMLLQVDGHLVVLNLLQGVLHTREVEMWTLEDYTNELEIQIELQGVPLVKRAIEDLEKPTKPIFGGKLNEICSGQVISEEASPD
ncbi:unnamed protein product [Ilex paraguariensis]|uniref:F-box domain-containing protein n=1 Tax=Ilex paraguariensis TaxID=185542 RepID=A0ABC8SQX2_9AQUA